MNGRTLVADVGGTNVRFARSLVPGHLDDVVRYSSAQFTSFEHALERYLTDCGDTGAWAGAAIGAAGPVDGDAVQLTNLPWQINMKTVSAALGGAPVRLFNDLEAVALSLPGLQSSDLRPIGSTGPNCNGRATMLAVNVGTGFGACAITPAGDTWRTVAGEAGHMSLPGNADLPATWPYKLQSVEDVLSGRGVAALYGLLSECDGPAAGEIFARAKVDAAAAETMDIVGRLLGRIAGDVALATGAWGGVFLTGSVAEGWAAAATPDTFRHAFEDKGAMTKRMAGVATAVITLAQPALVGLSRA